ncbi:MAG: hypothetical protein JKY19_09905 [Alcanivoracaceae bacterium]|nr:hypothetical protein [Alcanivoracaceae bacterium]
MVDYPVMSIWTFELLAFIINIIFLSVYLKVSHHYHWFDKPNEERKLHQTAKPTAAGLIFMLPLLLALLIFPEVFSINSYLIAWPLLILLVLGGVDDFKPISVRFRLGVITLVSGYFLYAVFKDANIHYLLLSVYLLGLIWWLNLYNFMDGADGMTALHAVVCLSGYIFAFSVLQQSDYVALPYMLLFLLCLLSFLLFNFPRSKMFMGDAGSLSVAFVLAAFALYGLFHHLFDETLVISFHLVFIIDTTLTLLTRMKFRHKLSQAHNLHVFQTMIKMGKSHAYVSMYYALLTVVLVIIALYLQFIQVGLMTRVVVLLLEGVILSFFWIKFHNKTKFERFVK